MPMMQGMGWQELKEMEYDCMRRLAAFLELEPRILESENAWHAGGVLRCNISHERSTTISIELEQKHPYKLTRVVDSAKPIIGFEGRVLFSGQIRIEDCKLISEVLKDLRGR
ncbi:hypothetical protein Ancab_030254 [Ancistrocladus abbreviatus]